MKIVNGKLTTAAAQLRELWEAGEYRKALKLAAGWPRLGGYADAIRAGWSAANNPRMYRELGKDPEALVAEGLRAISARYGLPRAEVEGV